MALSFSLLECSDVLLKFANNKSFFVDYLNKNLLGDVNNFQSNNQYSEQGYMLHHNENYFVRLTYWPVLSKNPSVFEAQNNLFSYGFAHDHNFSLLTAGYKGKGYKTNLWEYDHDKVIGYKGEAVDINFLETAYLGEKKALYYRPSKDIHCQFPPEEEDTLAINIILKTDKILKKQYEFDVVNKKIKNILYGSGHNIARFGFINMAKFVNNEKTIDLLEQLSMTHNDVLVRQESLLALYQLTNSQEVWKKALHTNTDSRVKAYARVHMENALQLT